MTDREMLLMAYGSLKAVEPENENLSYVISLIEEHLYPSIEMKMNHLASNGKEINNPNDLPRSGGHL